MSKSYRKKPFYKAHCSDGKKLANERVRNAEDIPNGNGYKKVFSSYDVIDYTIYAPWEEWKTATEEEGGDIEAIRRRWEKFYLKK